MGALTLNKNGWCCVASTIHVWYVESKHEFRFVINQAVYLLSLNVLSKYPNMLQTFFGTSYPWRTTCQASIHTTDHCDTLRKLHQCLLEQKYWPMNCAERADLSPYDVQPTKLFYSDSVISVFSYTTRFSLFLWFSYIIDIANNTIVLSS